MATSKVGVSEGSGKNLATHSLTEDSMTKEVSRVNLNDSAGVDILGSKTDAKATATDATAVSAISIWKQISASVQAAATSLASVASGGQAAGPLTAVNSTSVVPSTDGLPFRMSQDTSALLNGNTSLTPKFATVAASSSGDNQIVAAVTSKKIRVLSAKLVANGAVNAKWQSDATDKTGLSYFAAAGDGEVLPFNPLGWFETAAGEKLDLNLSAAVAVGGHISYVEV